MKIAYLTNQYPHVRHTFIRREIVALESHGVEVFRFSIRDSGGDAVDPADKAEKTKTRTVLNAGKFGLLKSLVATLLRHPIRGMRALRTTWRMGRVSQNGVLKHIIYLAEACVLKQWLREAGAEHLHVHFATNPTVVARLCEILGGPRYSITIHGPEEWDRPEALSLTEKYEHAAFTVAVSDFGRCQVYRWCGLQHWNRVHVVRCGVDDAFLQMKVTPVPETKKLALVGALVEQKGHLLLLRALEIVAKSGHDFQMVFVGDGHLRPIIEKEIRERGLEGKVHLAGWQSNAQVRQHLQESRALVMPSFAENLPVAMMEALAMGRPVLGTYIAGVPELVEPGVTGWLVPAGNIEKIAEAVIRILQTPLEELNRMGETGAAKVAAMHDAKKEALKLIELFGREAASATGHHQ